jgi:hypothetical protein
MTKQQACAQLAKYPHDPLLTTDIDTQSFEDNCWCRGCVAVHEERHKNQWVANCIQPQVDSFSAWCSSHQIDILCSQYESTHCATAMTATVKEEYDVAWYTRVEAAYDSWNALPDKEADARASERDCYQAIINALKAKCSS